MKTGTDEEKLPQRCCAFPPVRFKQACGVHFEEKGHVRLVVKDVQEQNIRDNGQERTDYENPNFVLRG